MDALFAKAKEKYYDIPKLNGAWAWVKEISGE
jgi:hypothetical protein